MYSRITVYKTILAPHFEYCPTILLYLNECDKNNLHKSQNPAMRMNHFESESLCEDL